MEPDCRRGQSSRAMVEEHKGMASSGWGHRNPREKTKATAPENTGVHPRLRSGLLTRVTMACSIPAASSKVPSLSVLSPRVVGHCPPHALLRDRTVVGAMLNPPRALGLLRQSQGPRSLTLCQMPVWGLLGKLTLLPPDRAQTGPTQAQPHPASPRATAVTMPAGLLPRHDALPCLCPHAEHWPWGLWL